MRAKLLKTNKIVMCIAQDKDTKSGFMMFLDNSCLWFGIEEFEFIP